MVRLKLKALLRNAKRIVLDYEVENALVKWTSIHLFERKDIVKDDSKSSSNEKDKRRKIRRSVKLFVAPTGFGKTWAVLRSFYHFIKHAGKEVFMGPDMPVTVYASSVKATIPVKWSGRRRDKKMTIRDKFEEMLIGDNLLTAEEFDKTVFVYHSSTDNLRENLSHVRKELENCQIPDTKEVIHNLIVSYDSWANDKFSGNSQFLDGLHAADSTLRFKFRLYILRQLSKLGKKNPSAETMLEFIRDNKDVSFIEELYPEVALCEKKIIFMTVAKGFWQINPIVYNSSRFFNISMFANGTLFIDESDQAYETFREMVINSMYEPYDHITMFDSIARGVQLLGNFENVCRQCEIPTDAPEFASRLRWLSEFYEGKPNGEGGLRKEIEDFYEKYNFKCRLFRSAKSFNEDEAWKGIFLFNSFFRVGIVSGNEAKYPILAVNKHNVEFGYSATKPDSDQDLLVFLEQLRLLVNRLFYFLAEMSLLMSQYFSLEYYVCQKQILYLFLLSEETYGKSIRSGGKTLHEKLLSDISILGRRDGVLTPFATELVDTCIAATGFQFTVSMTPDANINRVGLIDISCDVTPESLLLAAADKMDVMLVSATADFNCLIKNFNLKYIDSRVEDGIYQDQTELDELAMAYKESTKGSENVDVKIHSFGCDEKIYETDARERWTNAICLKKPKGGPLSRNKNLISKDFLEFVSSPRDIYIPAPHDGATERGNRIYQSVRLLNVFEFVKQYLTLYDEGVCPYAIFYSNMIFRPAIEGDLSPKHIVSADNLFSVVDFYLEKHPLKSLGKKQKLKAKDFIIISDADALKDADKGVKNTVQKLLKEKRPALILTSANSAGVGQNFQMYVSPEYLPHLVDIGERGRNYDRDGWPCANVPMVGIEKATHTIFVPNEEVYSLEERIIKCATALFDILSISDAGEFTPNQRKLLIRYVLERYGTYGARRHSDDEQDDTGESATNILSSARRGYTAVAAETRIMVQEIGRFSRESLKFKTEYIWIQDGMRIVKAWKDDRFLTYEMQKVYEYLMTIDKTPELTPWSHSALDKDDRTYNIIHSYVVRLRYSNGDNMQYDRLKSIIDNGLFLTDEELQNTYFKDFYLDLGDKTRNGYWVKYKNKSENPDWDEQTSTRATDVACEDICLDLDRTKSKKDLVGYNFLSLESTRLDIMLKVDGFAEFLQSKGVRCDWTDHGQYMLTPYAFMLYIGSIGELFVEFLFDKEKFNIPIERFGNATEDEIKLFELFDYRFSNTSVLLDVKNWSTVLREARLRDNYMISVIKKAKTCGVDHVVYVNCVGDSFAPRENVYPDGDWDLHVLEIGALVNKDGKINVEGLKSLYKFVYGL